MTETLERTMQLMSAAILQEMADILEMADIHEDDDCAELTQALRDGAAALRATS